MTSHNDCVRQAIEKAAANGIESGRKAVRMYIPVSEQCDAMKAQQLRLQHPLFLEALERWGRIMDATIDLFQQASKAEGGQLDFTGFQSVMLDLRILLGADDPDRPRH